MKKKLDRSLDDGVLAYLTQFLVIAYILIYTIETLPSLSAHTQIFSLLEKIFLSVFTIEYLLRVWSAPKKRAYIFSFFGIIDLIAILPSLFTLGFINFQAIRLARLMRLFKILKAKRVNASIKRLHQAFLEIRSDLLVFMFIVVLLLYFSSVGIYYFENASQPDKFSSIPQCLWWSLTTFTTVGYGDMYPVTAGGKIFTGLVLMIGLALVAIPTGLIASSLTGLKNKEDKK